MTLMAIKTFCSVRYCGISTQMVVKKMTVARFQPVKKTAKKYVLNDSRPGQRSLKRYYLAFKRWSQCDNRRRKE